MLMNLNDTPGMKLVRVYNSLKDQREAAWKRRDMRAHDAYNSACLIVLRVWRSL